MARSQYRSSISYLCVGVNSIGASMVLYGVASGTGVALSTNRHGVGQVVPETYLVGGRLGWCYPRTQSHIAW